MRTVSLASSQSCGSVDSDAWCKRALTEPIMMLSCIRLTVYHNQKKKMMKRMFVEFHIFRLLNQFSFVLSFVLMNWFHVVLAR